MPVDEHETPSDVAVAIDATSSSSLYWPQNHELAESSIPDLLAVVSRNALLVIPAERCVVFMYDKATNLLTAHVACGGRIVRDGPPDPDPDPGEATPEDAEEEEELNFPPVMGLVSACFLQRRCLRMQEPNVHKAFYRDYDVPKRMAMNSIIAAPVTLHHRTVGVIELINRIDPDAPLDPPAVELPIQSATDRTGPMDDDHEIKLLRTTAVQQRARIGFSAKDEQKMIQCTSHVAQLLDNKLKLLAQVESAAKFRDEQAKTAMELLEMMNQKLEYRSTPLPVDSPQRIAKRRSSSTLMAAPVEWTPKPPVETPPVVVDETQDTVLPLGDMMKVLVGISRTQAIFRGQHLRKVHRLSEALQQHRLMRKRIKSALVIQRATRRFLARHWRTHRRNAVSVIVRAIKAFQARLALAQRMEIKKKQKRKRSVVITKREGAHHSLVQSDVHVFRERYASAIRIQQHFRGHKARKQIEKIVGFKNLTKGLKNIVKLQSILRGSLARKHVEKIREEQRASRAANVVCMRIAATNNDLENDSERTIQREPHFVPKSRDCVYPLPGLPTGAHVVANRIPASWSNQPPKDVPFTRRRKLVAVGNIQQQQTNEDSWIRPLSRPLAPSPRYEPCKDPFLLATPSEPLTRIQLTRLHPEVVFELDPKRVRRCPPGVQHADDWRPRRPTLHIDRRVDADDTSAIVPMPNSRHKPTIPRLPTLVSPTPRSDQLQVCFVPAGITRRPTAPPPVTGRQTARPFMRSLALPVSLQRPFTTR